jgi:ribulose bisphosphate carboxylase small subunit
LINPNTLKGFFLSLPPMDVEKMFDAIQEVEECNDDFDGCAVKLSAL